jgi:hypothetical protein
VLLSDSITVFESSAAGAILVTGSHGGLSAVAYATALPARGVIVNDAGVGKDAAGIGGLAEAAASGVAVVAVGHTSARIGDGLDTWESGRVTHGNALAEAAGVLPGMAARQAAEALAAAPAAPSRPRPRDAGSVPRRVFHGPVPFFLVDSAAAVGAECEGAIVVTGSHGGAAHGRALDVVVAAAVFNDAGIGKDGAGVSRLPVLDAQRVPAMTVSHLSARIGEADDTYRSGIVSMVNERAARAGIHAGMRVTDVIARLSTRTARDRDRA